MDPGNNDDIAAPSVIEPLAQFVSNIDEPALAKHRFGSRDGTI